MVGHGFTPVLALRTITSLTRYVNGCVLQEQSERREHPGTPPDRLAALAEQLDGGMEATLITAFRESGGSFGEDAFEHGLRALINGTAIALARTA